MQRQRMKPGGDPAGPAQRLQRPLGMDFPDRLSSASLPKRSRREFRAAASRGDVVFRETET